MTELARQVADRYYTALRVADRFAAKRPMKPEKLTELMLKLRKGAWGSLKMDVVDQVLSSLGGWKIEEIFYLKPASYNDDNLSWYSSSNLSQVKTHWDWAKSQEVDRLPSPDQLSSSDNNQAICMEVGEIHPHPKTGEMGFYQKAWQVTPGTRVIAPNGKDFKAKESLSIFFDCYPTNLWSLTNVDWMKKDPTRERFTDWLKKDTPFFDQLNQHLNLESYEAERAKARTPPRTRANTGTCPCCFGNFKLVPKTRLGKDKDMPGMTLHGYKRPGVGYIEGNCFGQDWPPFELSSEGTVAFAHQLEKLLDRNTAYLARLESGEVTTLANGLTLLHKDQMDPREWERAYASKVKEEKARVKDQKDTLDSMKGKVTRWKAQPLPEETQPLCCPHYGLSFSLPVRPRKRSVRNGSLKSLPSWKPNRQQTVRSPPVGLSGGFCVRMAAERQQLVAFSHSSMGRSVTLRVR